tara:strand:- start:7523 stop:7762 length:240 start_codon:yes stop_codon:yes gene_type:complete
MATKAIKKKYKNVPNLEYTKTGHVKVPEGFSVNQYSNFLIESEKYHNKKKEKWKPGKYVELLKSRRKMKKYSKPDKNIK